MHILQVPLGELLFKGNVTQKKKIYFQNLAQNKSGHKSFQIVNVGVESN